jgi:hypothetical protein
MAGKAKATVDRAEESLSIAAQYPTEGLPRPEAVNYTSIDRLGAEVQVSVGFVDIHEAVRLVGEAKQGVLKGEATMKASVSHRLVFGIDAFMRLKAQVDQIVALLTAGEADEKRGAS